MQYETNFGFKVDDNFSMYSQAMTWPRTCTSFSSASSHCEPATPTFRHYTPREPSIEFDSFFEAQLRVDEPNAAFTAVSNYVLGKFQSELDYMSSARVLPWNPPRKVEHVRTEYDSMLDLDMHALHFQTISSSTSQAADCNGVFGMAAKHMMVPESVSDSPSQQSLASDSPVALLTHQQSVPSHNLMPLNFERQIQSPSSLHFSRSALACSRRPCSHQKRTVHAVQRQKFELHRVQTRTLRTTSENKEGDFVDLVHRPMCACDYPGCRKTFRRKEHLKRHKQTFHGEGPNRFSCEFCERDQFNRQDNLNSHRKLHAHLKRSSRGVEFIPAAVPILEQEERGRKRTSQTRKLRSQC